ncbi:Retrovirus-related Pol polyprotein from transposon opus, partial [Mucuna pruriens]
MFFDLTNAPKYFHETHESSLKESQRQMCCGLFSLYYLSILLVLMIILRIMLLLLQEEPLYVNLEKYTFCTNGVIFQDYVVGSQGFKVDVKKVKTIQCWSTPKFLSDVRSFHGLASFYRCFVKDFSTLTSLLNEIVKKMEGLNGKKAKKEPSKL